MKNLLLILFFLFTLPGMAATQEMTSTGDSVKLSGKVIDGFTKMPVDSVKIEISEKFGSFVNDTIITFDIYGKNRAMFLEWGLAESDIPSSIEYDVTVPHPGVYVLKLSKKGYATQETEITIPAKRYSRKTKEWTAKDIMLMRQMEKQLGEATVTATKIMMVHRGDTIVFNADYFQMAEGSMLDKLIEKMPGLEIRNGGEIFYNGKKLDNLLVNGKDFFKGDPAVALQNLPAYMVKEVKVYEKKPESDYLNKWKDNAKGEVNTMDVVLKKEYSHGWITNYEVAGGPRLKTEDEKRQYTFSNPAYLGRIFGLHFGDRSRFGIFGSANNVGDVKSVNSDGNWNGWNPWNGDRKRMMGGMLYNFKNARNGFNYNGTANITRETTNNEQKVSSTTFLPTGDTFNRSSSLSSNTMTQVKTRHNFDITKNEYYFNNITHFTYEQKENTSQSLSAQFTEDPLDTYRSASLDTLFSGRKSERLESILTNRLEQHSLEETKKWTIDNNTMADFNDPWLGNVVSIWYIVNYSHSKEKHFEHYDLRYGNGAQDTNDYRNRYTERPNWIMNLSGSLSYSINNMLSESTVKWLSFNIEYSPSLKRSSQDKRLYNLQTLAEAENLPLGQLPSMTAWRLSTLDGSNSYNQHTAEDNHVITPNLKLGDWKKGWGEMKLKPIVTFYHRYAEDTRSLQSISRNEAHFTPSFEWNRKITKKTEDIERNVKLQASYSREFSPVNAFQLMDIRDDSNPLSISKGNPNLKASKTHKVGWGIVYDNTGGMALTWENKYSRTNNATAMGYDYNTNTGVYTYRPENVNGNWDLVSSVIVQSPLGEKKKWNIIGQMQYQHTNSADLMNQQLSIVRNNRIWETLRLTYKPAPWGMFTAKVSPSWVYATSDRENYHTRNTQSYEYGIETSFTLPHNISINSTCTLNSRRGYEDQSMNDNECVWDGDISWNFDFRRSSYRGSKTDENGEVIKTKGTGARPWTLKFSANDILHQQRIVYRELNSQGITETWFNAVPSYMMLHLIYRFTKTPKKR